MKFQSSTIQGLWLVLMISAGLSACGPRVPEANPAATLPDPCRPPAQHELRAATFNIHAGRTADIRDVSTFVASLGADIVGVQEVDRGVRRTGSADQVKVLEATTGLHATFAKTLDYQGGSYGFALLTQSIPRATKRFELPAGDEARAMLVAELDRGITVGLTHLGGSPEEREAQVEVVLRLAAEHDVEVLLGDFNHEPGDGHHARILAAGWSDVFNGEAPPTADIRGRIATLDYIFVREVSHRCPSVLPTSLSDHAPVVVTLGIPAD